MFRRKRASSNPPRPVKTAPNAAAFTAASQAFLANRASNANLSNAAAAAALRSHTTSPSPVGDLQTKRMQRRGSASSNGSAPGRPGSLQRRDSGGSMTERSFRETPNRPASSHGPYPQSEAESPPPVPALPKSYNIPAAPPKSARRPASVEPTARVSSPPPRQSGGRGASLDRGSGNTAGNSQGAKAGFTSLNSVGEIGIGGNRTSVNFSRPMSPTNSPPVSPLPGSRVKSPSPYLPGIADRSSNSEGDPTSRQEKVTKQVFKNQVMAAKDPAGEFHLGDGPTSFSQGSDATKATSHSHTSTPATLHASAQANTPNEMNRPKKKKKKKVATSGNLGDQEGGEGFGTSYPSDTDSVTSEQSSTADRPRSYNSRAAGLLAKQPSVVREDKEGEEKADMKSAMSKMKPHTVQDVVDGSATPANTSKVLLKDRQYKRKSSQQTSPQSDKQLTNPSVPISQRSISLSPARAAHFSSQPVHDVIDITKHQPPARSVSPAKSALKHSPSRGHSPIMGFRQSLALSETSDTASAISDDGYRSSAKSKKKNVRVSFEDDSVTSGRVTSPSRGSNMLGDTSLQDKPQTRSWLDLVREKKQEQDLRNQNKDTAMKPTPTLPSFGSVRGNVDAKALKSAENRSASDDRASDTSKNTGTSSDRAAGYVISQDAAKQMQNAGSQESASFPYHNPLPPEVTSVEGSGYHSDGSDNIQEADLQLQGDPEVRNQRNSPRKTTSPLKPAADQTINHSNMGPVPSIAFQPATPGIEGGPDNQDEWLGMPGEFPTPPDGEKAGISPTAIGVDPPSPIITPAKIGIAEPETAAIAAQHDQGAPVIGEIAQGLRIQIESQSGDESEDTTGDSIYSDAAEDQSDLDGDGFGSINAIVESPAAAQFANPDSPKPDESTPPRVTGKNSKQMKTTRKESELPEPASDEGWDRAQAYWSGLTQTRRQQLERAAVPGAIDEPVVKNRTMRGVDAVPKKKKRALKTPPLTAINAPSPTIPQHQSQTSVARPASPKLPEPNSQARNSAANGIMESQRPTSMRGGPPTKSSTKSSTKHKTQNASIQASAEPKGSTLHRKARPVSAVAMVDYKQPRDALPAPNHARAASAGSPQSPLTPVFAQAKKKVPKKATNVNRTTSNGSDSSSSFKRERSSAPESKRYTMKRSMRPSSTDARALSPASNRASSMTVRTSNPADSTERRPFSSVGPGGMRTSMRAPVDSPKSVRTSLRSSVDSSKANRTKSPSRFGFSKGSKSLQAEAKPVSRFSSRFGESSDEEGGLPAGSSSRFADSSDDDEIAALSPVRGIPLRTDEGESTDLEDSSIENTAAPNKNEANGVHAAPLTRPEGLALASGSLRTTAGKTGPTTTMGSGLQAKKSAEKEKKKRSFFSGLGSKKREDPSKAQRLNVESHGQRDTLMEEAKLRVNVDSKIPEPRQRALGPSSLIADPALTAKNTTPTSTARGSPKSPKLQRRNTPQRFGSTNDVSWPLAKSTHGRPRTSDGPGGQSVGKSSEVETRGSTVRSEEGNGSREALAIGTGGKKKRFPMLRKAFGLRD